MIGAVAASRAWPCRSDQLAVRPEQVGSGDRGLVAERCVSLAMVVVPGPAVKRGGAFCACAVDGSVRPAVEEGADEAFCFAVGLRSVGAGAQVADAEGAAGDRVDR